MNYLIILITVFLTSTGCTKNSSDTMVSITGYSYLALGDSYTIGESVSAEQRFPAQTVQMLSTSGIQFQTPQYIATTGWTTANLISAIKAATLKPSYDIVSLLIGVNDQYQGVSLETYKTRFTQLIERSIQLAANKADHVFVLSIPDYSVTPFAANSDTVKIRQQLNAFNAANETIALNYHVNYINITPSSREAKTNTALIANDGLHPSGLQYKNWALLLSAPIKTKIN
jgi:lysophospholipase L1-like esterase